VPSALASQGADSVATLSEAAQEHGGPGASRRVQWPPTPADTPLACGNAEDWFGKIKALESSRPALVDVATGAAAALRHRRRQPAVFSRRRCPCGPSRPRARPPVLLVALHPLEGEPTELVPAAAPVAPGAIGSRARALRNGSRHAPRDHREAGNHNLRRVAMLDGPQQRITLWASRSQKRLQHGCRIHFAVVYPSRERHSRPTCCCCCYPQHRQFWPMECVARRGRPTHFESKPKCLRIESIVLVVGHRFGGQAMATTHRDRKSKAMVMVMPVARATAMMRTRRVLFRKI
jgi:hypothetical protein